MWRQLTWVEDGTGTALDGPGLRVKGGTSLMEFHLRFLIQDLFNLDLHFCMRASIVSGHHLHHQHCNTNRDRANNQRLGLPKTQKVAFFYSF